jgi:uncharacterized protein YuzE
MTSPILSYDPDVSALYIQLSEGEIVETLELSETVYVDVDADGQAVGFEILHAEPALLATLPALPDTAALRELVKSDTG